MCCLVIAKRYRVVLLGHAAVAVEIKCVGGNHVPVRRRIHACHWTRSRRCRDQMCWRESCPLETHQEHIINTQEHIINTLGTHQAVEIKCVGGNHVPEKYQRSVPWYIYYMRSIYRGLLGIWAPSALRHELSARRYLGVLVPAHRHAAPSLVANSQMSVSSYIQ